MADKFPQTPVRQFNIERTLDKTRGLSTIHERVEAESFGRSEGAVDRNLVIPFEESIEEEIGRAALGQQRIAKEAKAYQIFLDESGQIPRRTRRTEQHSDDEDEHERRKVREIYKMQKELSMRGSGVREEDYDEELDTMLSNVTQNVYGYDMSTPKIQMQEDFPDATYDRERSLLMNTIIDDDELDEALEFIKNEYYISVDETLQDVEKNINKKYNEDIKRLYQEEPEDLEESLAFLEEERQTKLDHIKQIKKDVERMSKPSLVTRRTAFGLSPITEESPVAVTPTPERLPPLIPRSLSDTPILFAPKLTRQRESRKKFSTRPAVSRRIFQQQEIQDKEQRQRIATARAEAAEKARAQAAKFRPKTPVPVPSKESIAERAKPSRQPQTQISESAKRMKAARILAAKQARVQAKAKEAMTPKTPRPALSRESIAERSRPSQDRIPVSTSAHRLAAARAAAAEQARLKAKAKQARTPKTPRPALSRESIAERSRPSQDRIPVSTSAHRLAAARAAAAEQARLKAKAKQARTPKTPRPALSRESIAERSRPSQDRIPASTSAHRLAAARAAAAEQARLKAKAKQARTPKTPRPALSRESIAERSRPSQDRVPVSTSAHRLAAARAAAAEQTRAKAKAKQPLRPETPRAALARQGLDKILPPSAYAKADDAKLRAREMLKRRKSVKYKVPTLGLEMKTFRDIANAQYEKEIQGALIIDDDSTRQNLIRQAKRQYEDTMAFIENIPHMKKHYKEDFLASAEYAKANIQDKDILQEQLQHLHNEYLNRLANIVGMVKDPSSRPYGPWQTKEVEIPLPRIKSRRIPSRSAKIVRSEDARRMSIPDVRKRISFVYPPQKSRIEQTQEHLRNKFLEEEKNLRENIDDPQELEEELEFLREEYESKLKTLEDVDELKRKADEKYQQRVFEAQQLIIDSEMKDDLMEFLQDEHKTEIERIEEDVGLSKVKSPITEQSVFQPSVVSKTVKIIPAARVAEVEPPRPGTATAKEALLKSSRQGEKTIGAWKVPSKSTIKLKKKVERDLEKLRKQVKNNKEILEMVEKAVPTKVKISTESIRPLTDKLGIKTNRKLEKMLDQARKKTYQMRKKIERLPPTVAENLTKRGIEQLEIDPLQKEGADAIMQMMMLEQSGINMKGDPKDVTNLFVPSDAPKVDILGNSLETTEQSILPKSLPTSHINEINPLASEEIALTLKTHPLQVPPDGIVAKDLKDKIKIPIKKLAKEPKTKVDYLECDVVLNSFNIETIFQARGTLLPKWFPGYFTAFPDESVDLTPYKSPSEILLKAWQCMKPEYLLND